MPRPDFAGIDRLDNAIAVHGCLVDLVCSVEDAHLAFVSAEHLYALLSHVQHELRLARDELLPA